MQDLREASRAAEQKFGLGAAQLFVLQTLAQAPGLSVNGLAARTDTHQSSVSAVLQKLLRRKRVAARPVVDDARRLELSLTPKGLALSRRAPDAIQVHLIGGLDSLSKTEREALARGLGRLVAAPAGSLRCFLKTTDPEIPNGKRGSRAHDDGRLIGVAAAGVAVALLRLIALCTRIVAMHDEPLRAVVYRMAQTGLNTIPRGRRARPRGNWSALVFALPRLIKAWALK